MVRGGGHTGEGGGHTGGSADGGSPGHHVYGRSHFVQFCLSLSPRLLALMHHQVYSII